MCSIPRNIPYTIERLEALKNRLPINHPKRSKVEADYRILQSKHKTWRQLSRILTPFVSTRCHVLHNIDLTIDNQAFHIDTLMISSQFLLLIDLKNQQADQSRLFFLFRETLLKKWLKQLHLSHIPMTTILVANTKQDHCDQSILISEVSPYIETLQHHYEKRQLSAHQCQILKQWFIDHHTPDTRTILDQYKIDSEDLTTGVSCPSCSSYPMTRLHGRWQCPQCGFISHQAHMTAIRDYGLLINETITNKELRQFLHLSSRFTTKRIIDRINAAQTGTYNGSTYNLNVVLTRQNPIKRA
ncbi:NERD domain-containing protein [Bacillus sp. FJAT-45037]|uniref:NERD domain-containing protein n=1 Tax=Bacillus sp. FJAT-45037 TaxID=2011007 RepID=UPI000C231112|nr:NERD domain-containing protein [Bacillus sp. FJAT-45037]